LTPAFSSGVACVAFAYAAEALGGEGAKVSIRKHSSLGASDPADRGVPLGRIGLQVRLGSLQPGPWRLQPLMLALAPSIGSRNFLDSPNHARADAANNLPLISSPQP